MVAGSLDTDYKNSFIQEIQRIAQKGYVPTQSDILNLRKSPYKFPGMREHVFAMGSLSLRIVDVGGERSERRKWIHQFDNVTSIMFCVDITQYHELLLEEHSQNRLMESLV